jgi:hypothetical protein
MPRQVKRHLEFVDQLVKDKAELSSRCERLVEDLKLLERKFEQRQQEAEERAQRELKKQRDSIVAAEKMRRDAWMQARHHVTKSRPNARYINKYVLPAHEAQTILQNAAACSRGCFCRMQALGRLGKMAVAVLRDGLSASRRGTCNPLLTTGAGERQRAVMSKSDGACKFCGQPLSTQMMQPNISNLILSLYRPNIFSVSASFLPCSNT